MADNRYWVRVTRVFPGDEYNYMSAYEIDAQDRLNAEKQAKKMFCEDFGGPLKSLKAYSLLIKLNTQSLILKQGKQ